MTLGNIVLTAAVERILTDKMPPLPENFPLCCGEHRLVFQNAFNQAKDMDQDKHMALIARVVKLLHAAYPEMPMIMMTEPPKG